MRLRMAAAGLAGGSLTALLVGVPTDVVPTSLFTRMTPVRTQDYVFLILTALLMGALAATYAAPAPQRASAGRLGFGSGFLSYFAIGCPICNKLVVALLGLSGALDVFAPIQPFLGGLGIVLAALALTVRLRAMRQPCPVPATG